MDEVCGHVSAEASYTDVIYARPRRLTWERIRQHIADRVERDGNGCLLWKGPCTPSGYGRFKIRDHEGIVRALNVHRMAWQMDIGPIPAGMEIDHLCRVRNCIELSHLDCVTPEENRQRALAGPFEPSAELLRIVHELRRRGIWVERIA